MAQSSASKTATAPSATVMQFDGKDDYIDCGSGASLNLTKTITMEAWIRFPPNEYGYIIAKVNSEGDRYYAFAVDGENNDIDIYYSTSSKKSQRLVCDTARLDNNAWHHVALTIDDKKAILYTHGVAKATKILDKSILDNADIPLLIGKRFPSKCAFDGQIAEVRIWNVVRTAEQIKADMSKRLSGNEPGLVGYWPLDDGSGTIAKDKTKNANHGTLHGATWATTDDLQLTPAPKPKKKTQKAVSKTMSSDRTLHIPAAQPRTLHATGLEDYNYWWETLLKQQLAKQTKSEAKKPYRRGRIWS